MATRDVASPWFRTYADATARTADTVFTAGDVGKVAWQQSDDTLWILTAATPTWTAVIGGSGGGGAVTSVFTRAGAVVATSGDYAASLVTNDSGVSGSTVKDALNALSAGAGVTSVFGRTGAVTAQTGDYTAAQVTGAVPDTRQVIAGTGLTGGGTLAADRTLTVDTTVVGNAVMVPWDITSSITMRANQAQDIPGTLRIQVGGSLTIPASATLSVRARPVTRFSTWDPNAPDIYPHFQNDEFDGSTGSSGASGWNAKWYTFDPNSVLTKGYDTTRRMGTLSAPGAATVKFGGVFQPLLSSEFVAYGRVHGNYIGPATGAALMTLAIAADVTVSPSTSQLYTLGRVVFNDAAGSFIHTRTHSWTNSTTLSNTADLKWDHSYFRIRVSGTTYTADSSADGVSWNSLLAPQTLGFTPKWVGFGLECADVGTTAKMYVRHFRIQYGSGYSTTVDSAPAIGQYV